MKKNKLTSSKMVYTSTDPTDPQWPANASSAFASPTKHDDSRSGNRAEEQKEAVDHIFLAKNNRNKEIRDDDETEMICRKLFANASCNEDRCVDDEDNSKETSIQTKE
jgi:hypothetical protein